MNEEKLSTEEKLSMPLDAVVKQSSGVEDTDMDDNTRPFRGRFSRGRPFRPRGREQPYVRPAARGGSSQGNITNRVYVGNLPWTTSWQDLKDHMRANEKLNVVFADILEDDHGKSKGCGVVEYSTKEEALYAIKHLNDTKIGMSDRLIFVREDREPSDFFPRSTRSRGRTSDIRHGGGGGGGAGAGVGGGGGGSSSSSSSSDSKISVSRQIFIGNLPFSTSWQDIKDHFRSCGHILRADVLMTPDGKSRGQATILFEHKWEALKAIETLNNTEFQSRIIFVQEDKYAKV